MTMSPLAATLLSVVMLGALVLLVFGARFAFRPEQRRHGLLMMVMAMVLVGNVLIWVV